MVELRLEISDSQVQGGDLVSKATFLLGRNVVRTVGVYVLLRLAAETQFPQRLQERTQQTPQKPKFFPEEDQEGSEISATIIPAGAAILLGLVAADPVSKPRLVFPWLLRQLYPGDLLNRLYSGFFMALPIDRERSKDEEGHEHAK